MHHDHPHNCPSNEALQSLLSGKSGDGPGGVAQHVDLCSRCQSALDDLSETEYLADYRESVQKARDTTSFLQPSSDPAWLGMIDDIAIHSKIGAGGMGIVFRGDDLKLGRTVAVKVLKRGSSLESNRRFLRETRAAAKLKHPNLVPVYSAGQAADGRPYLVMPLVEGTSLKERLELGLPTPQEVAGIARQIATGLEHAHQQDICHRDIKPANIMLDSDDNEAKLTDFGLVRTANDDTLTEQDVLCGTPEYMSPCSGNNSNDAKLDDVYSLGIVLYECLTGTTPFRGQPLDVLQQHRSVDPQPPRNLNRAIPVDLETICLKSLSKEPSQRYASAAELADDLSRFLEDQPILARREGIMEKSRRWVRRNLALAVAIGLAFFLLSAGIVISTMFWLKSEKNASLAHDRLESITEINRTLKQNQTELSQALRNAPATGIASYNYAGDLPTSVRNQMLTEIAKTWPLLFERSRDNPVELREMAAQLSDVTAVADELGMFSRVVELTNLSQDVVDQLLTLEAATSQDRLLASRVYQQAAQAVQKQDPKLALQRLKTAKLFLDKNPKSEQTKIQLTNLSWQEAAWGTDKSKSVEKLHAIRDSMPAPESLDPGKPRDWAWLNQHQDILLELAKKSDPTKGIQFREQRVQLIERMLPTDRIYDSQDCILSRNKAVTHAMIGINFSRIGQSEKALENLRTACDEMGGLLLVHAKNAQYRADLFEIQVLRANLLWAAGKKEESLKESESVLEFQKLTLQLNPLDPLLHQRTAGVLEIVGGRYQEQGQILESAEANYEAAQLMTKATQFGNLSKRKQYREKQVQLFKKAIAIFKEADEPSKADQAEERYQQFLKNFPANFNGDPEAL